MSQSVTNALPSSSKKISLLHSDVDGTLITKETILTVVVIVSYLTSSHFKSEY